MTEIARIRVQETHGIRRFLYPLSAPVALPSEVTQIRLATQDGQAVPCEIAPGTVRFAISLAPLSEVDLILTAAAEPTIVDDPLTVATTMDGLTNSQTRFAITLAYDATISKVVYDGVAHLSERLSIARSDEAAQITAHSHFVGAGGVTAWAEAQGAYSDGAISTTHTEITACKSWATVTHRVQGGAGTQRVTFVLPFAVTSPTLIYDCGIGNGLYGAISVDKSQEWVWHTDLDASQTALCTLSTSGRLDYVLPPQSFLEFAGRRWFHLVDGKKAIGVAITGMPSACDDLDITLRSSGEIAISFTTDEPITTEQEYSICYHFLNDIPAIAAATNPQSILLAPTVTLLPA